MPGRRASRSQAGLLLMMALRTLQNLSGSMTPRESMPDSVQVIMQVIMLAAPNTHFVVLAQAILHRGTGFLVVWPQLLALSLIRATLFVVSLARFRRTRAAMA